MNIRPTVATVDLSAIRHNLRVARELAPGASVCAVVKANAYGHGLVPVGKALADADWLAVALVEEGVALREAGVTTPVLVLGAALDGGWEVMLSHDLVPAIFRHDHLEALAAASRGKPARFHLKLDTGMARLGLRVAELPAFLEVLKATPHLKLDGVLTHFANADLADFEFNQRQVELFDEGCAAVVAAGHRPSWLHVSNSAAVLSYPEAHRKLVRPGLMIYGLDPRVERGESELRPAMRWVTTPVHIKTIPPGTRVSYGGRWTSERESRVATLPVGYADGYPRSLSNKAHVLIRGERAPVLGTVCMDLFVVDVTDIPGVTLEEEVVLMGDQGQQAVTAYDLADWAETIPYEITCGVSKRVPRLYRDGDA